MRFPGPSGWKAKLARPEQSGWRGAGGGPRRRRPGEASRTGPMRSRGLTPSETPAGLATPRALPTGLHTDGGQRRPPGAACPAQTLPAHSMASPGSSNCMALWLWKSDLALCPLLGAIETPAVHGHEDLHGRAGLRRVPEAPYPARAPCSCAAHTLPTGPEPRTSAQTKLTARPEADVPRCPFSPQVPVGGFVGLKGLRWPPAVRCLGSKCEVRRGCRWKRGRTAGCGGAVREAESRGRTRGTRRASAPSAGAEASELRRQHRAGRGPSSSASDRAAGEKG